MTASDSRIEEVVDLLARLASGELDARGNRSALGDDIDAVIEGINMLAEELEASHGELEDRVRERTAALKAVNGDMHLLAELGNLLAACETADEAYGMIAQHLTVMFGGLDGAMYLYRASRNILEPRATWGAFDAVEPIDPRTCWALRRGHTHLVDAATAAVACQHVEKRTERSICIPMSAHGETVGMLHVIEPVDNSSGGGGLTSAKYQLAVPVAEQISLALANIELREMLRVQALRDPLTGLRNRRFADEWIHQELARSKRHGRSLGVMMIDVDHFKQINDVYGHEVGDVLLRALAESFVEALRPDDMPCRYGGEEFIVLLADIDADTLQARAEILRRNVAELSVEHRKTVLPPVTISVGIAVYPEHGMTAQDLIQAADAALYAAKRAGRNRTMIAA